ncbi:gram-negative bacteria-binding protein 2 [Drosophila novamexicana]|uniref:gram-negative bacteria-binding protein 2 n=1 Tax=Drosophila novamexicana TaxID=47314 RepID=UPI0011E59FF9|nr:gram-negative bacteria-binding protein 2 [Drosophila novamexicana]
MICQLFLSFSFAWLLLKCRENLAYEIPNVDMEMLNKSGFEVSIPDEPGMQRVFYMLQVDGRCPALMDYITQATNGSWTSKQSIGLQNNDKLQISILVQYNDLIYEKSETRVILNTRLLTTQQSISRNISNRTSAEECQVNLSSEKPRKHCKPASSIVSSSQGTCQGELLFEDNFSGAQLNRSVWMHDIRQRMYHEEEELVAFDDSPRYSYVRKGQLHIVPMVASEVTEGAYQLGDRCTAVDSPELECSIAKGSFYKIKPPVYSAQLHTRQSFSFKYGKIVVRAKLPKGDWLFPYVMLQPVSTHAETHYANQLRIAYARGNAHLRSTKQEDISGNRLYGGMIVWQKQRAIQIIKERLNAKHYGDDFHNYTMIWQRDKLTLMVDDEIYGEIYDGLPFFNEKCFIILGVTVGGFLNFDDNILMNDVKPYKNQQPRAALSFWQSRHTWASTWGKSRAMIIDYVRVYAD